MHLLNSLGADDRFKHPPEADETTAPEANEMSNGNNLNRKKSHDKVSPFHSVGFKTDVTKRIIKVLLENATVRPNQKWHQTLFVDWWTFMDSLNCFGNVALEPSLDKDNIKCGWGTG